MVDTTDEWILQRTGIRERHIVDPGVATSDLAKEAALKAIEQAGLTPADIGLIIVGTTTPDMMFPSTACLLQHKIGAHARVGLRSRRRMLGFTYALTTAAQMVASGAHEHALVGRRRRDVEHHRLHRSHDMRAVRRRRRRGGGLAGGGRDVSIVDFECEIDGSGGPALCMPAGGSLQAGVARDGERAAALREAGRRGGVQVRGAEDRGDLPPAARAQRSDRRRSRSLRLAPGQQADHPVGRREARASTKRRSSSTSARTGTRRLRRFPWR